METLPSAAEKQRLISSFREIAADESVETAAQFLQATSWKLEEALQLFFVGNDGGALASSSSAPAGVDESPSGTVNDVAPESSIKQDGGDDEVRAPLPIKRDTLYGDASFSGLQPSSVVAFRNFEEESRRPVVWESNQNAASTTNGSRDNLASLYRPPFALMYNGPFDKAKVEAALQGKWLIINLQSREEFSSHMLNRDTWANETLAETIRTNFIFWQVYHDSTEGKKVCTYYNLVSVPAILVIDPITGQKMRAWSGMVQPDRLLEDLLPYLDKGPKEHHAVLPQKRPRELAQCSTQTVNDKAVEEEDEEVSRAIAASLADAKSVGEPDATEDEAEPEKDAEASLKEKPIYPPLPGEPKGSREILCRVAVRLPDGRRVQRNFLKSDPIKLLWSFCCSQVEDADKQLFHFTQAIPGASKSLEFDSSLTFGEAGLSNSIVSLAWD
ncbi:plant UBX domain-containing protein 7 [Ananas comosus]|uniref:UBX domain-containing protein n=1 Tax=Ananas comosus TaxID=4615 RepID=A0A6P5FA04_ANACO|nr:plant UBX domain-containing protein 7 [Ananas comosus]XP_020093032.1 plant UBX domain-containing protein 7 [Ananas comosus]